MIVFIIIGSILLYAAGLCLTGYIIGKCRVQEYEDGLRVVMGFLWPLTLVFAPFYGLWYFYRSSVNRGLKAGNSSDSL